MFALSILAAFAALLVLAAWIGAYPPVGRADRDRNYPFRITMREPSDPKYQTEPWVAVLSQELGEWLLRWLVAILIAAPFVWALDHFGYAVAAPLPLIFALAWTETPFGERQSELVGHMIEAEAAMRVGHNRAYIAEEARRTQPSYPCFKNMTAQQVMNGMLRRRWLAKLLLAVVWRRARRLAR